MPVPGPLALEGGGVLRDLTVAYETWGELEVDGSNAVLLCHALTGDSHAHGDASDGHPTPGWWNGIVGPGCGIDTEKYFVVCANVIGGCQGSTGPASIDPATDQPYGPRFPVVSVRDMVRTQEMLADELGVDRWLCVTGGSMGGMQALEWAVMYPDRVQSIAPIATASAASAQQIAWSAAGRWAIEADPRFSDGDFYDSRPGKGPHRGLGVARTIAMIHYRSDLEFERRFGRRSTEPTEPFRLDHRFEVEDYLAYQGDKIARRFDANTYLVMNKAMDLHDVGRGRGGIEAALARVKVPTLTMGITSDFLYPAALQAELRDQLANCGVPVRYVEIDSDNGHDSFLIDADQVGPAIAEFLESVAKV